MKALIVGAAVGMFTIALALFFHRGERSPLVANRSRPQVEQSVHVPSREQVLVRGAQVAQLIPPPNEEMRAVDASEPTNTAEELAFRLEQRFKSEAAPTRESLTFGTVLRTEVEEALAEGARVLSADCRELSCRLTVAFPSLEADKQTFENFGKSTETAIGRYGFIAPERVTADDGSLKTTLYVSKSPTFSLD